MSMINDILRRVGLFRKQLTNLPLWLRRTAAVEKFNIPDGTLWRNQAELYQRLSWIQIAVSAVARAAAADRLAVKEMVDEKTKEIVNHPFELLLMKPNPLMSRFEFLESTFSYLPLTGNAYWWLNKANPEATPDEMWIIPSYKIQPVPDENLYIAGYAYDPGDGNPIPLETWEVVHFKKFHPLNTFVGLSAIEALAVISVGDLSMQDWNTRFFGENNARLPGILAFKDMIQNPEWDAIKEDTIESSKKRQLMMLRGAGSNVDWMQAAVSQAEMEFLDGRTFNQKEIYDAIAPGLFGMLSENATEANARTAKATFNDVALWPLLDGAGQKVTNNIMPAYGDNLKAEFDDVRITDRAMELSEQSAYSRVHTIDEIREEYYDDDPLGDERGDLLPTQVGQSAVLEPGMELNANPQQPQEQLGEETGDSFEEEPEEAQRAQKAAVSPEAQTDLAKWERKALRRLEAGKRAACDFESEHLSGVAIGVIHMRLQFANTPEAVKGAFVDASPAHTQGATLYDTFGITAELGLDTLTSALHDASKALRETIPSDIPDILPPQQTFHISLPDASYKIDVPPQAVTVNVPPVDPPVVNVQNDIHIPEQPAPEVTVNVPEPKPRTTTVKRDVAGEIMELETK